MTLWPPRATMRLQLHKDFTFDDAAAVVPYIARLGMSHVYASPILTARAGSMHGYDVVDPTRINPELGGEDGYRRLVGEIRKADLGIILDIVPNHMAVGGADNAWWLDVLQKGRASRYASYFDIDWEIGKILVPFLGRPYGEALAAGELSLLADGWRGGPAVRYFHHLFPIREEDWAEAREIARNGTQQAVHRLLERQHYRLAWWRTANEEINWRRFFDVSELAGLRVEVPEVFEATHSVLLRLYEEGLVDGFRIDHIDGLTDPDGYCRRLRDRLDALSPRRPEPLATRPYLVVEKILGPGEALPSAWPVDGTTGYDFMNEASALLHAEHAAEAFADLWADVSGRGRAFEDEEVQARREIVTTLFASQLDAVVRALHADALADPATRDWSHAAIRRALVELVAHFNVYRTYARDGRRAPDDQAPVARALAGAAKTCRRADRPLLTLLERWLGGTDGARAETVARFQQLTAPVAAKAVEDTAFYRYGRLVSRNDVGFDPRRFALPVAEFHQAMQRRAATLPLSMLATATHDHKRGEDVRARLAALSEDPAHWREWVERWFQVNANLRTTIDGRPAPSPGDELILYQMIVGAWPMTLDPFDKIGMAGFAERLAAWQRKGLREAKLGSEWIAPDEAYEAAADRFLAQVLSPDSPSLQDLAAVARSLTAAGAANGLAQALIKFTAPGVPDLYQGTEYWDFSLVDPDNRRPVDFGHRSRSLGSGTLSDRLASWRDGPVKQHVIAAALRCRQRDPDVFTAGDYAPIEVAGPRSRSRHVFGFLKTGNRKAYATLTLREPTRLLRDGLAPDDTQLADTIVRLPRGTWVDEISGIPLETDGAGIAAGALFQVLPVALLRLT